MDLCSAIDKWVQRGCVANKIDPMFVKNIDYWTGQKMGGALFNQKFQTGEPEKLLLEVRRRTEFLIVKSVVKVSGAESNSLTTHDGNISDNSSVGLTSLSDLLADSETDQPSETDGSSETDELDYGPILKDVETEEGSVFIFNVKEESCLAKIYGDKTYRNGLSPDDKDLVMHGLAKEVLEQRVIMTWGRKLHILRGKCEGRRVDLVFLNSLQEAFDKNLASYIVKSEHTDTISSLMEHLSIGSVAAADLSLISDLFDKFDKNLLEAKIVRSQCSEVELIDLTGDDNEQMKQKLHNLEQKVLDRSDALKESLQ